MSEEPRQSSEVLTYEWYVVAQPLPDKDVPRRVILIRGRAIVIDFLRWMTGGIDERVLASLMRDGFNLYAAETALPDGRPGYQRFWNVWNNVEGRLARVYVAFLGTGGEQLDDVLEARRITAFAEMNNEGGLYR